MATKSEPDIDRIRDAAMELSTQERAQLADDLYDSIMMTDEQREIQREWDDEAMRRLEEYRAGRATVVSHEDALASARAAIEDVRNRRSR